MPMHEKPPSGGLPFAPAGADPCNSAAFGDLLGAPVPSQEALAAIVGPDGAAPARIRVVRPGQAITMDHMPQRLNIELDDDGVVIRLRCG